jgi:hypothetical protein
VTGCHLDPSFELMMQCGLPRKWEPCGWAPCLLSICVKVFIQCSLA